MSIRWSASLTCANLSRSRVKPGARKDAHYLGLEHLASGRMLRIGEGNTSEVRSTTYAFQSGDVLYGKLRPYLDKAVLADKAGVCTTELLVLRVRRGIDPRFLVAVIHSPDFVKYAITGTTGVNHPRTSWPHIREFKIPALLLDEQRKVVNLLLLVYETIRRSEEVVSEGQALKCATMRTLFTRGMHSETQKDTVIGPMPKSWKLMAIRDVVKAFKFDRSKQVNKRSYATTGRWPIIDQGQKFVGGYTDNAAKIINSKVPVIVFGDHTCVFKFIDTAFALGADGTKPLLAGDGFYPKYLYHSLCNLDIPKRGYNRHYTILADMLIGRPPLCEQRRISNILDGIDRKIDIQRRKSVILEDLLKMLLRKIMVGEIHARDLDWYALSEKYGKGDDKWHI